jgi:type I protein arginine methyltransferase
MYSVYAYGTMIKPGPRVDAYLAAMARAMKPGCTVMDLGCGPGYFAAAACRLGAGKVYAVETDPVIDVAREVAARSGFGHLIEFVQGPSQELRLGKAIDVIVSDLRGVMPLFRNHIPSVVDARERLLAPDGVLVPSRDTMWAAPVENARQYETHEEPWRSRDGVDLYPGRRFAVNSWRRVVTAREDLLAGPARWGALDYYAVMSPNVSGQVAWTVERAGTCHGFTLWFDAELDSEVAFSNAPGQPELIYGQAFHPLAEPVSVERGDSITLDLDARLVGQDYIWIWNSAIRDKPGSIKAQFAQSSFQSVPISPASLRKRELSSRPLANEEARATALVLTSMDGASTLEEIVQHLLALCPGRFPTLTAAQSFVGELVSRYSR